MTLSELSIRRPVLAAVASLLIVVFGLAALTQLPIRELPDIDAAVVTVTTTYTGAAPEIVDTDITEVIEGAIAGISGVKTIQSQSRRGRSRIVIEFEIGRDIDEAANDVRDAVGRARAGLPVGVDEPQIVKSDSDANPVMRIAVMSDRLSPADITDYVERFIVDRLSTIEGVADVTIFGERRYAVRIWLDRRAMAARNLTVADVEAALRRNNIELPSGEIESTQRMLAVRLDGRLSEVQQFRDIVVDRVAGYPVRLADIAQVVRGVEDDQMSVRSNDREAVGLGVIRQSQANTVAISNAVREAIGQIEETLPEGMSVVIGSDDAVFVSASIREVAIALGISLILVVLVILLFLMSLRATLIPAITIPVALIGSFALIGLLGFSINVLTLLALLLAIGLVVDDAIVMLENIKRRIDLGESPLVASVRGARQVTFAILATSATLIAVFVPISFLEGAAGRLFTEFGFVMASAVVISTFVALSACPALASKVLAKRTGPADEAATARAERRPMMRLRRGYERALDVALRMPLVVIAIALAIAGASAYLFPKLPSELTPTEDRGVFFVSLTAPQGSSIGYTEAQTRLVEDQFAPLRETGEVETIFAVSGTWGRPNRAFVVARLVPWEERERSAQEMITSVAPGVMGVPGIRGFPVSPAGLGLRGSTTPLRVVVGGPDFASVEEWAEALLERAEANPSIRSPDLDYEETQPQIMLRIDRSRADDLGISAETIASTLQTMFASREITTYIDRGREYPVIVQALPGDRQTPGDIANVFVRAGDGVSLVPLRSLVSATEGASAAELRRYNRLPSITIQGALEEGYDLGSAIAYMQDAAQEILPPEATLGFSGQSQHYLETSSGIALVFALALLIVFLVLAGQFESFLHPLIIMLSVPLATAGAIFTLWFTGVSLNIYSQIGIILLIGLMAKNGILIVEFANQLRDDGRSVREAVREAASIRLRPIIMTVVSTVLGALPLVLATGAGAESRFAIGIIIMGGLGFASILTLFLTPVLYDRLAGLSRPRGWIEKRLAAELDGPQQGDTGHGAAGVAGPAASRSGAG